ncbi:hypothetical protein QE152_g25573 [Popillia japonica]|uniref:Transposase n=1 Tax=Popillia japonica TaxID=7064 RepID=A0AAW1K173_POPJA
MSRVAALSATNYKNARHETGVQMNKKPGKVIATKGSKLVQHITSGEKGETISLITCNNAEGIVLPPVLIIKGVNQKPEFLDGLPPGSTVYMNKKSAYINSGLFMKCYTTHGLQPLDRSFFKPFKTFYATELRPWIVANKERKITTYQAGKLIGAAWIRATSTVSAISGFKACGIFPYNPNAIPEHYYTVAETSYTSFENTATINMPDNNLSVASYEEITDNQSLTPDKGSTVISIERASSTDQQTALIKKNILIVMECSPSTSLSEPVLINISPTQHLLQLFPIPIVTKVPNRRKRQVLNCPTVIDQKKNKVTKALKKVRKKETKRTRRYRKTKH